MAETLTFQNEQAQASCCTPLIPTTFSTEAFQQLTADLQLLGHPVRLQILAILAQNAERVCVCDLEAALPVKQPTVSHHLKLLREAGLIDCERRGLWAYYFINPDALAQIQARTADLFVHLG